MDPSSSTAAQAEQLSREPETAKDTSPKASIGRIVLFLVAGSTQRGHKETKQVPAIIQAVNEDGTCRLACFLESHVAFENNVRFGLEAGCWMWPVRT